MPHDDDDNGILQANLEREWISVACDAAVLYISMTRASHGGRGKKVGRGGGESTVGGNHKDSQGRDTVRR